MNICQEHWDALRAKIIERGLEHLIAQGGASAAEKMKEMVEGEAATKENFEPLIDAWGNLGSNVMETISRAKGDPLYLMTPGPEDPVEGYPGYEDRTWPKCGVCYLGLAHEMACKDPRCELPKVNGYDWMLDRAADDAQATAKELGLI